MKEFLVVALGGAVGASARYSVYVLSTHYLGTQFPHATLIVNTLGSFLMGVLIESIALVWSVDMTTRLFLAVGILGAFTTFSTFALDTVVLYERGQLLLTGVYITASVVLSIGALFLGLYCVRQIVTSS